MLFKMFLPFVLYGQKPEECNLTWPIAEEAHRCTFWAICTLVSWKTPFLCILRNFWYSWLTDIQVLVVRSSSALKYGKYTENVLFIMLLVFFSDWDIW